MRLPWWNPFMAKKTIDQVDVRGRRVFMRVDLNVPLDDARHIQDDRRITAALPSMLSVLERGGRLVLASHLGRPSGKGPEPEYALEPVAKRLQELLPDRRIEFVPGACTGPDVSAAVEAMDDGEVVLLDNLRFDAREKKGDDAFARELARGMDIYCNDAFGTAHRNDASMYAVPRAMEGRPRVAGQLLARELLFLADTIAGATDRFVAVLGGAKVSDKLRAVEHLLSQVDDVLIGGAMAYTFLKASGVAIGGSRVEQEMVDAAGEMLARSGRERGRIHLPVDHHAAAAFAEDAERKICGPEIPDGWIGLDIGPETMRQYGAVVKDARTVVWNGPMGVFEMPPFDAGTRAVAEAMVKATEAGATTVVGGGDSAAAIELMGLAERVSHVSTGGGASLEMLEGRRFDSVALLDDA